MPEILHEQEGLTIKRNDKNGVVVASLFFFADPHKRDPSWIKTASAGMSASRVRKEYYIDYTAQQGERVFKELSDHRSKIVVRLTPQELASFTRMWAGFDYGTRSPSAVIVLAEGKNADGDTALYAIWEHYEPTKNLQELCTSIKECGYYDALRWISCDPSLFFKNQQALTGLTSIGDQMLQYGIDKLVAGVRNEESFIAFMHTAWSELDRRASRFFINENCPNLIREMENIVYESMTDAKLKAAAPKETMTNRDNHAIDALKYFINSYAAPVKRGKINDEDAGGRYDYSRNNRIVPVWKRHMK